MSLEEIKEIAKKNIISLIEDIKFTKNIEVFEKRIINLKSTLVNNSLDIEDLKKFKVKEKYSVSLKNKFDVWIYPLSMINSSYFDDEEKKIIKNEFENYLNIISEENKINFIVDIQAKIEDINEELNNDKQTSNTGMPKLSFSSKGAFDFKLEVKQILKDQIQFDEEEGDSTLDDVYYKTLDDGHYAERDFDPIPLDFYLNEDGFWDNYIMRKREKIEVKNFTYKPFQPFRNNIKKGLK